MRRIGRRSFVIRCVHGFRREAGMTVDVAALAIGRILRRILACGAQAA
jgi:hypothetical protein